MPDTPGAVGFACWAWIVGRQLIVINDRHGRIKFYVEIKVCVPVNRIVLRELGSSADRPFRRSASGGRFGNSRTNLNARIVSDSAGRNGNAARRHSEAACWNGDTTSEHRDATRQYRNASYDNSANNSKVPIAERNFKYNCARLDHAGSSCPRRHNAAVNHQSQHAE